MADAAIIILTLFIILCMIVGSVLVYIFVYRKKDDKSSIIRLSTHNNDRVFKTIPNFLSKQDCDTLIGIAQRQGLYSSSVLQDFATGKVNVDFTSRFTESAWLSPSDYPVVYNLFNQVYQFTGYMYPITQYESLQITRYTEGPHFLANYDHNLNCNPNDAYCQSIRNQMTGYRLLTIIIALNDNFSGGGVWFPYFQELVKLKKGDALIFQNSIRNYDGTCRADPRSAYEAMPVTKGERYVANIWIRGDCNQIPPIYSY